MVVRVADKVYLALDGFAGGDEKERREQEKEERERQAEEMGQEMAEVNERRGRSVVEGPGGGEGRVSPFVNGNIRN